jgi:uncharacterized protein YjiS (DUF1127 family)
MSTSITPNLAHLKPGQAPAQDRSRLWASLRPFAASATWRWFSELVRQRRLRRLEDELAHLDDRTLKDIGLDRSEIGPAIRWGRHL